jgi:hypothetical protein
MLPAADTFRLALSIHFCTLIKIFSLLLVMVKKIFLARVEEDAMRLEILDEVTEVFKKCNATGIGPSGHAV